MGFLSWLTGTHNDPTKPPGQSRGLLRWLRDSVGSWLGPRQSAGTPAEREVTSERIASGPRGITLPNFLPYVNDQTGETATIRAAYRQMWASPDVKSALLSKLLAIGALDLKIHPPDKKNPRDKYVADFVGYCLKDRIAGGFPELVWSILSGGLPDGFSVCEKVWASEERGKYASQVILKKLKPKDTTNEFVVLTDEFKNITGFQGLRYNAGLVFSPASFVVFRYLPLYSNPVGMSDFRAAYQSWWMLDTVKKMRAIGLDKRSLPVLIGTYKEGGSTTQQGSLESALKNLKSTYWATVPEGCVITALNIAGGSQSEFDAACKDLKHDIFLAIAGAILQALEGETQDGAGNSQVHRSTADLFIWYLSSQIESLLNDRDNGLIRDLVDLNFVVDEYPRATLSAVDVNELVQELAIDTGLHAMGIDLSKDETYERYGRNPPDPSNPDDKLPGQQGGPAPGGPPGGGSPFDEFREPWRGSWDAHAGWESLSEDEWSEFAADDWQAYQGPKGGKGWKNAKTGKVVYGGTKPGDAHKAKPESKAKAPAAKPEAAKPAKGKAAAPEPAAAPAKPPAKEKHTVESVTAHAKATLARPTPEGVLKLVDGLLSLKVAEMKQVRDALGGKGGKTKSELAKKIAEKVGAKKPEQAPTPKPAPQRKPATAKPAATQQGVPAPAASAPNPAQQPTAKPAPAAPNPAHVAAANDSAKHVSGDMNIGSMADLRDHLATKGITDRAQQDAAIHGAHRAGHISLAPHEGRHGITPRDEAAQIQTAQGPMGHVQVKPAEEKPKEKPELKAASFQFTPEQAAVAERVIGDGQLLGSRDGLTSLNNMRQRMESRGVKMTDPQWRKFVIDLAHSGGIELRVLNEVRSATPEEARDAIQTDSGASGSKMLGFVYSKDRQKLKEGMEKVLSGNVPQGDLFDVRDDPEGKQKVEAKQKASTTADANRATDSAKQIAEQAKATAHPPHVEKGLALQKTSDAGTTGEPEVNAYIAELGKLSHPEVKKAADALGVSSYSQGKTKTSALNGIRARLLQRKRAEDSIQV